MIPRATLDGDDTVHHDSTHVQQVAPHLADFGDGDRLIRSAGDLYLADVTTNTGIDAPMIVLTDPAVMTALSIVLDADSCRELGKQLISRGEILAAGARLAANAALRKAACK